MKNKTEYFWYLLSLLVSFGLLQPVIAWAQDPGPVEVTARFETTPAFDDEEGRNSDSDDPAIWLHPSEVENSLVVTTKKEGGLAVFDLDGNEVQDIAAPTAPEGSEDNKPGRYNNVDLIYSFPISGSDTVDLAVVSDRGSDKLVVFAIDPTADGEETLPLTNVTAPDAPFIFSEDQAEVNEERTAYGLAVGYNGDQVVAFASQRERPVVAMLSLTTTAESLVDYTVVQTFSLPSEFELPDGSTWTPCQEDDEELPQVEGMVIDEARGLLYLGQEQVGIWRTSLATPGEDLTLLDSVREYGVPYERTFDEEEEEYVCELLFDQDPGVSPGHLSADVEGLTIYYHSDPEQGYLLASSQGDNTFAVYERAGSNAYLGSFQIVDSEATDSVQESDGAMVINVPLGDEFPNGLFVTQDGDNMPVDVDLDGEARANTNFKFVAWEDIANAFPEPLLIEPAGWSPREQ